MAESVRLKWVKIEGDPWDRGKKPGSKARGHTFWLPAGHNERLAPQNNHNIVLLAGYSGSDYIVRTRLCSRHSFSNRATEYVMESVS